MAPDRGKRRFRFRTRTLLSLPVLVAVVASFPIAVETSLGVAGRMLLVIAPALPTLGVCAVFFRLSPHPRRAAITTVLGACVGIFFSPIFYLNLQSLLLFGVDGMKAHWESPTRAYDTALPAVGASIFGALGLIMADARSRRPRRAALSVLRLVLVATIVGLSTTVAVLNLKIGPLRAEVSRLRYLAEELDIDDPTKLHVIRVDTASELEWKWRIWLPERASYCLRGLGGQIPRGGYSDYGVTIPLEPGEHVVRYVIRRDPRRDGRWCGSLHTRGGGGGRHHHPWVEWSSATSASAGVGPTTRSYKTEELVEIIRHRVSRTADSSAPIEDPANGFMIWLEPD